MWQGWRLHLSLILFGAAIATCAAIVLNVVSPIVSPLADGKTPSDFMFLLFPSRPDVPVFDTPEGRQIDTLNRAMANSYEEMNSNNDWIALRNANGVLWVKKSDLTYVISDSSLSEYFQEFAREFANRPNAKRAEFEYESVENGIEATLTLVRQDETRKYKYVVRNGVPQAILAESDVRHALQAERMVRLFICFAIGTFAYFVAWSLVRLRRTRLST